jgi:hypothetical protein
VTKQVNALITKLILPKFSKLLGDEDPIPPFGIKMLNTILEKNMSLLQYVYQSNLVPYFFKFFELEHPNNNIHNIKLIKKIVDSDFDKRTMYSLGRMTHFFVDFI